MSHTWIYKHIKQDKAEGGEVLTKTIKALHNSAKQNFTITTDNGTEFADHKTIAKKLGIDYYFAHPYASFERGSIEHLNALIRQYISKGTEFSNIDSEQLKNIQHELNNRPRKVLGFLSPLEYTE